MAQIGSPMVWSMQTAHVASDFRLHASGCRPLSRFLIFRLVVMLCFVFAVGVSRFVLVSFVSSSFVYISFAPNLALQPTVSNVTFTDTCAFVFGAVYQSNRGCVARACIFAVTVGWRSMQHPSLRLQAYNMQSTALSGNGKFPAEASRPS
jgi:choline-glycine betaine transporter